VGRRDAGDRRPDMRLRMRERVRGRRLDSKIDDAHSVLAPRAARFEQRRRKTFGGVEHQLGLAPAGDKFSH
jgi:hypothetical protein